MTVGSPCNERRITNVAPGINGTDAVNMNQLNGVQSSVNSVARNVYSGIAAATALTMPPEVDPGKTLSIGIGAATYNGYRATSFGVSARITRSEQIKAGMEVSSAGIAVAAGIGRLRGSQFRFRYGPRPSRDAKTVGKITVQIALLRCTNRDLPDA